MTAWRAPTWRPLSPDEIQNPDRPMPPNPRAELWAKSPAGLPVAARGFGLELVLLSLHLRGYRDPVSSVLENMAPDEMSCTAAVDFFIGYDMVSHVARCLEQNASACDYVLELPPSQTNAELAGRIVRAKDMARTALAKRYAIEAISEMGLGLET